MSTPFLSKKIHPEILHTKYMSIPRPDLRGGFLFFPLNIFGRTYSTYVYVHECLEEECRIINESGSCTLRPLRLLPGCFPLHRRQKSRRTYHVHLLRRPPQKHGTSKGLAWRLNKSQCNSANTHRISAVQK